MLDAKDVLIVDDDQAIRNLVTVAFRHNGLSCDTAVDGVDALEKTSSSNYFVILVDLMMPRLDGRGFVTALREREATSGQRPVVVMMTALTARDLPDLGSNVQAVVQKPFDLFAIAELVRDCVESRRSCEQRVVSDLNRVDGEPHIAS